MKIEEDFEGVKQSVKEYGEGSYSPVFITTDSEGKAYPWVNYLWFSEGLENERAIKAWIEEKGAEVLAAIEDYLRVQNSIERKEFEAFERLDFKPRTVAVGVPVRYQIG